MRATVRLHSGLVALAFCFGPLLSKAWGCPACAGRAASDGLPALLGLGGLLLLPLLLGAGGLLLARRVGSVHDERP